MGCWLTFSWSSRKNAILDATWCVVAARRSRMFPANNFLAQTPGVEWRITSRRAPQLSGIRVKLDSGYRNRLDRAYLPLAYVTPRLTIAHCTCGIIPDDHIYLACLEETIEILLQSLETLVAQFDHCSDVHVWPDYNSAKAVRI